MNANILVSIVCMSAAFLLALVAAWAMLSRRSVVVDRRLLEIGSVETGIDIQRRGGRGIIYRVLAFAATMAPGSLRGQELRDQMAGAGMYSLDAVRVFIGSKVLGGGLGAMVLYAASMLLFMPVEQRVLLAVMGGLIGFHLPSIWLWMRLSRRQSAIRSSLPDALDLMVVCVESGLGLNSAILRVGDEIRLSCPPLSEELRMINQEIRAGVPRATAIRNFARRVPIMDVQSLAAMFIQADRLGTSIGRSLRVHADSLRTKRRQRAEERARKASIKLIFPLVFCIFPELLVVILGPAGIRLLTALGDVAGK
jgi:tight adherence protein C